MEYIEDKCITTVCRGETKNSITFQDVEDTSFFDNNNIVDNSIEITSVFGNTILFTCA